MCMKGSQKALLLNLHGDEHIIYILTFQCIFHFLIRRVTNGKNIEAPCNMMPDSAREIKMACIVHVSVISF